MQVSGEWAASHSTVTVKPEDPGLNPVLPRPHRMALTSDLAYLRLTFLIYKPDSTYFIGPRGGLNEIPVTHLTARTWPGNGGPICLRVSRRVCQLVGGTAQEPRLWVS